MNIQDIAHILRASRAITGETIFVLIGSQAVLAQFPDAPDNLKMSMEIDIWPKLKPQMAELIEGALGSNSPFHGTFGYCADGVGPESAVLPAKWEDRSVSLERHPLLDGAVAICPEIHDLCVSKLIAFREKDLFWVEAAFESGLADPELVLARLSEIDPVHAARKDRVSSWLSSRYALGSTNDRSGGLPDGPC